MHLKAKLKRICDPAYRTWIRLCARYPRLADIHFVFSSQFRQEHHAVLVGKSCHFTTRVPDKISDSETFRLRRFIHRIEKGLVMVPRRTCFGVDFIEETVDLYVRLRQTSGPLQIKGCSEPKHQTNSTLHEWCFDVLGEYFRVTTGHAKIARAKLKFEASTELEIASSEILRACHPYQRGSTSQPVDYNAMLELAFNRRSVRWYDGRPVPRELLDRALQIASLSPSACNRQPFKFYIVDDPDEAKQAAQLAGGSSGFAHNIPCLVVAVGDLRAYSQEYDRHLIYIDTSLAIMSFLYALESLGLSSCCLNWADIAARNDRMSQLLGLHPSQRTVMCISVGFADQAGLVPFSQKKSLDEIRTYASASIPSVTYPSANNGTLKALSR